MALLKDTLKIDGYENMTAEQKVAAWEAANAPEIDMSRFVDKALYDSKVSDLAAKNKKIKELETSQLSEADKLKQDRAEFEVEKAKFNKERNGNMIRGMFAKENMPESYYAGYDLDNFDDTDTAKKFATATISMVKALRQDAETSARNSLIGGKAPDSGITADQATKLRADYANAVKAGDTYAMALAIAEAQSKGVSLN